MESKQELLARLQHIISEHLGIQEQAIKESCTWKDLGADSLDRMGMSLAIEEAFKVSIPHAVGERLNTVQEAVDHLYVLTARPGKDRSIRIEAVTASQQWSEIRRVRTQVFTIEYGFKFDPLSGPGENGAWHFLARDNGAVVGTLSVVDTTMDRETHQRYDLRFGENDRVARYAQLAILKPYRKRGIFQMLIATAQETVIHYNGFSIGWLLYPAAHARSSMLTRHLGFTAQSPVLTTEFGACHALVRRELNESQINWMEPARSVIEVCPI
ncbi:MAG: acyl carrier protein [Candidatus Angelobacter sp.]